MIYPIRASLLSIDQHFKWCLSVYQQACRSFSSLDISPSNVMRNAEVQTIFTETLNIPHHGRLEVRCPFNLYITTLNRKDFPRLDKAFFTIYGRTNVDGMMDLFLSFVGDSSFQFSKETWKKLFRFSTIYSPNDQTLRLMGHFTQEGTEKLSKEAHTLEVYCQIPPHYGKFRSTITDDCIFYFIRLEVDINCSDNNNVSVERLESSRVHVRRFLLNVHQRINPLL